MWRDNQTQIGRLLCLLFVWVGAVSAGSGSRCPEAGVLRCSRTAQDLTPNSQIPDLVTPRRRSAAEISVTSKPTGSGSMLV